MHWRIFLILVLLTTTFLAQPASAYRQGEPHNFSKQLSEAALARTKHWVVYNGAYKKIPYPNGDVPKHMGVCTDVVIRAYRQLGVDLQKDVHLEMKKHFSAFPKNWGLRRPDTNIDHRRVPNLKTFFKRKGMSLPVTKNPEDYQPGDLVTWVLPNNLPHIGIVVDRYKTDKKSGKKRPLIVHNIGWGPKLEDMLFDYKVTGHYRYYGKLK